MLKWVLFDWRNTLANSDAAVRKADKKKLNLTILNSFGFKITKNEFVKARKIVDLNRKTKLKGDIRRHRKGAFYKNLLEVLNIVVSWKIAEEMEDEYVKNYDKLVHLMPNAVQLLKLLKKHKINVGIISNTRKERIVSQINYTPARDFVDIVITSVESKGEKSSLAPFKEFLKKASKINNCAPNECIMIGDRADEDLHSKKLGFTTILFGKNTIRYKTEVEPDFVANDFIAVKKIIMQKINF